MLISDFWLVLTYQYEGIREASFSFALSSAAGGAYAPTHLVELLQESPANGWNDLIERSGWAEEEALTQSGDRFPAPLMFQRTEEGIVWETCHGTLVRLYPNHHLEACWPLYGIYNTKLEDEVSILEESVRRRAFAPLNQPTFIDLTLTVDSLAVRFPIDSLDGLFEKVVSIARRCNQVGEFEPLPEFLPGIMEGDIVSLMVALDSWEEFLGKVQGL